MYFLTTVQYHHLYHNALDSNWELSGFLQVPYHCVTNRATIVQSYSVYWLNVRSDVVTLASAAVTTKPTTAVPDTTKAATTTSVATDKVSSFDLYFPLMHHFWTT